MIDEDDYEIEPDPIEPEPSRLWPVAVGILFMVGCAFAWRMTEPDIIAVTVRAPSVFQEREPNTVGIGCKDAAICITGDQQPVFNKGWTFKNLNVDMASKTIEGFTPDRKK
ncbi:MAG TPA: hypothetical protein VGP89_17895 [Candidatus Angelobacter sp.]|jgi:hypothetical protein|nr:hypothetical protein [Candidatus Angelobacter sp.]